MRQPAPDLLGHQSPVLTTTILLAATKAWRVMCDSPFSKSPADFVRLRPIGMDPIERINSHAPQFSGGMSPPVSSTGQVYAQYFGEHHIDARRIRSRSKANGCRIIQEPAIRFSQAVFQTNVG